jgi:hypothetical protein
VITCKKKKIKKIIQPKKILIYSHHLCLIRLKKKFLNTQEVKKAFEDFRAI